MNPTACGAAPADPHDRITDLEQLVGTLAARVAALEHRTAPAPLATRNAEEHARSERLREAIRQLLEEHPGPERGAAKRIYPHLLEADICLSVRAVQHYITQLRKASAVQLQR